MNNSLHPMDLDENFKLIQKTSYGQSLSIAQEQPPGPVEASGALATPRPAPAPELLAYSQSCADLLGLKHNLDSSEWLALLAGNVQLKDAPAYAMNYAGHQFGNWAGQLGDGRAINIAELETPNGRMALQLKGAGPTAFSRRGDGFAVLRSSIREFLCSEAMHALGVPTTRALSLVARGEPVWRDMFYDGRAAKEPSAVVCRVAPSFIRFGHFELPASRGDQAQLQQLFLFTLEHYFPEIWIEYESELRKGHVSEKPVAAFFNTVCDSTARLVAHWQTLGFTHGVLNTDNMSIHGITLDYGPYGWLEPYQLNWTPNTTDAQGRRYAFGQQPKIALWNLWQFGNALARLVDNTELLTQSLQGFQTQYDNYYAQLIAPKLGLKKVSELLVESLQGILVHFELDMTLFFRGLMDIDNESGLKQLIQQTSYQNLPQHLKDPVITAFWLQYSLALEQDACDNFQAVMRHANPKYVLRNYLAYQAIEKAEAGDLSLLHELHSVLQQPFTEQGHEELAAKRPDWASEKPGCSALSCSS